MLCAICFSFALKKDTKFKLVKTFVSILMVLIAASYWSTFSACSVCASSSKYKKMKTIQYSNKSEKHVSKQNQIFLIFPPHRTFENLYFA